MGKITALMDACRSRQRHAVELLLSDAEAVNAQSASGCTALYLAAEEGDDAIVGMLLVSSGAGVCVRSDPIGNDKFN